MKTKIEMTALPDFALLSAIHQACFAQGWNQQAFSDLFNITGTLAFTADIAGFGILRLLVDEAEILTIAVLPEARRQGIGKTIFSSMLQWAKEKNVKSVFLEVAESNITAQELYKSAGFAIVSRRKNYYNHNEDAIVMQKSL